MGGPLKALQFSSTMILIFHQQIFIKHLLHTWHFFFFFFLPHHVAYGILVPWPVTELVLPALGT